MSNQIKNQADKLWQTLSAPTTFSTYQQALNLTWSILKETVLLLWLVLCLVLVFFDWFGNTAIALGRRAKTWFDNLQTSETDQIASDTGKALLEVGKTGIASTLSLARAQLGLPEKPAATTLSTPAIASAPPTVSKPMSKPAVEPITPTISNTAASSDPDEA